MIYGGASGKRYSTQWLSGSAPYSAGKYKSEYDAFGRKTADVILNNSAEYSRTDYTYDCMGNVLTAKDDKTPGGEPALLRFLCLRSRRQGAL